jgi:hypothetical protein
MQTTVSERFTLRVDGRDVLLFRRNADGTASLLAVTDSEWSQAVAAAEDDATPVDTIRRLFAEADESVERRARSLS